MVLVYKDELNSKTFLVAKEMGTHDFYNSGKFFKETRSPFIQQKQTCENEPFLPSITTDRSDKSEGIFL